MGATTGDGGALAAFERTVEGLVQRALVAPFRGPLHPRELARRLERAMRDGALLEVDRNLAPNEYDVRLHADDYQPLADARATLESELASYLARAGGAQGFSFLSAPRVHLVADESIGRRIVAVTARVRESDLARAAAAPAAAPAVGRVDSGWRLEVAGHQVELPFGALRVGRAPDCDVVLPSPHVSRYHAEVIVDAAGVRLRDLDSTNGTMVDGEPANGQPVRDGARIAFGAIQSVLTRRGGEATAGT